ncbi:ComEA family DNA-binding protein [Gilvimarinus algae]|uniref:Helix-hairpin-helix domain-containing protein n=1 Tax=Gilvimarinus algae TaxID=3058037 RepID=A0ABT8TIQ6_9GAMM|nr:helix-hairpin-helix domain-containing protein [Gilvimarinus sp. SDUM040014]MDO3382556.1 helix-hairpin-helix domain-containing protein [Gilvimarinus sp. SDUM040014]
MKKLAVLFCFLLSLASVSFLPALADDVQAPPAVTVNINTADVTALTQLKGVGETKAQAIIAWREENGPFESADELLAVNGIGEATLEDIRDNISL